MPQSLVIHRDSEKIRILDSAGKVAEAAKSGVPIVCNLKDPYLMAPVPSNVRVNVEVLPKDRTIPVTRLNRMLYSSVEQFRYDIGFVSDPPEKLTAAIAIHFQEDGSRTHEIIIGGPQLEVGFNIGRFYGHDKRDNGTPTTKVQLVEDPSNISFRIGSNVSPEWKPLQEMFPDSLATPGCSYDWNSSPSILGRFVSY